MIRPSILFFVLAMIITACSSAKNRSQPSNITQDIYKDYSDTDISKFHRAGVIYDDFKLVLEVDALLQSKQFRRQLVEHQIASGLGEEENRDLLLATADDSQRLELILILFHPSKKLSELNFNDYWKLKLFHGEQRLPLNSLSDLSPIASEYTFINQNSRYIDRWANVIKVEFLKPATAEGHQDLVLYIEGATGRAELNWEKILLD